MTRPPLLSPRVEAAFVLAGTRHAGQTRRNSAAPYVIHLAHVALLLARAGADDDTLIVALLHDVVEDTARGEEARRTLLDEIRTRFGEPVADAVATLSEPKHDAEGNGIPWPDRKRAYLEQLSWGSRIAHRVSAADKLHNTSTLLDDLEAAEDPYEVWSRFTGSPQATVEFQEELLALLEARLGPQDALVAPLRDAVVGLRAHVDRLPPKPPRAP